MCLSANVSRFWRYPAIWIVPAYFEIQQFSILSFLFADNPSGKGRYFGPSHNAINAANGIETKGHPLRHRAKERICPARLSGTITTGSSTMAFEDIRVHVRLKLFALWSSLMFFYIYADYFQLWQPGHLQGMLEGRRPFAGSPQGVLLGMSCVMVVPCLMPFLSVVLPVRLSRWVNILFGVVYTLVMVAVVALARGWYFYTIYGLIEIILSLLVLWYAWTWPKKASNR